MRLRSYVKPMKKALRASPALLKDALQLDAAHIDRLYGLEPAFEPGLDPRQVALEEFLSIRCPYCRERFEVSVDLTLAHQVYYEDCQVCCNAIELTLVSVAGQLVSHMARRSDGSDA